jgi:hypothetical protein
MKQGTPDDQRLTAKARGPSSSALRELQIIVASDDATTLKS